MKRKSFTNYQKAGKKGKKPFGQMQMYKRPVVYARRNISMQPEVKCFDTTGVYSVATTADWTGSEVTCTSYVQSDGTTIGAYTASALGPSANGPGYGECLGGKYRIMKIRIRGYYFPTALAAQSSVQTGAVCRLALVMDEQAGGAQLQGEQVFTDLGAVDACTLSYQQQGQVTAKFRVLKDKRMVSNVAAAATDGANTIASGFQRIAWEIFYSPKAPLIVNVLTSGATPAIAQIKDNNLFLLARSTLAGSIVFASRCYYTDS